MMKNRDKMIAYISGGVGGLLVLILLLNILIFSPLRDIETRKQAIRDGAQEQEIKKRQLEQARTRLRTVAARRIGDDELRVSETMRVRLDQLLQQSGLSNERLSLKPMVGQRRANAFREVGWTVSARGNLEQITDFFYLLDQQPFLLRVDEVAIRPVPRSNELNLDMRCSTLVIEVPGVDQMASAEMDGAGLQVELDSQERRRYAAITQRDLFRPYVQREPPAVAEASPPPAATAPSASPGLERFKVVDLTSWNENESEIRIMDLQTQQVKTYRVGQSLAGGQIEMVDYRALPRSDNPALLAYSRIIVKIEDEYWAIDLGQTLADRRRLQDDQLPEALRTVPTSTKGGAGQADKKTAPTG